MLISNDLLLQWSLAMQTAMIVAIAAFFGVLARSTKLAHIRLWTIGWIGNAIGLTCVLIQGYWQFGPFVRFLALSAYAGGKTLFCVMLVIGARHYQKPGASELAPFWRIALIIGVWSCSLAALFPSMRYVHPAQCLMVGIILTYGAAWVLPNASSPRSSWLGWAFMAEGLLFLHYAVVLAPRLFGGSVPRYLNYASVLDGMVELVIALTSMAAFESAAAAHLHKVNEELLESREQLRRLVDSDPLTGLANRRALRSELRGLENSSGAAVLFIDLDNFKAINDRHGHDVGDECLKRVALELQSVFRPTDHIFRWGGDEFVVIAPQLSAEAADSRAATVRHHLLAVSDLPHCSLSYGIAWLAPDGKPEAALKEADERMYLDKRRLLVVRQHT